LPSETDHSVEKWREWADHFNTAGAAARRAGIWLAFHNEPDHAKPIDGVVPYDVFVQRSDPSVVRLQLDVGNMVMGGGDPMRYLSQHADRYWSFHVKDIVADRSHDVELGQGAVDLRAFLAAVPNLREKPVYVEQEGSADSMASAARNFSFLSKLDF
jgi:sugar phosphate isomerase/epimerase